MKGVLAGLMDPSKVALLDNAGSAGGVERVASSVETDFSLLGLPGAIDTFLAFSDSCKVFGVVMFTEC